MASSLICLWGWWMVPGLRRGLMVFTFKSTIHTRSRVIQKWNAIHSVVGWRVDWNSNPSPLDFPAWLEWRVDGGSLNCRTPPQCWFGWRAWLGAQLRRSRVVKKSGRRRRMTVKSNPPICHIRTSTTTNNRDWLADWCCGSFAALSVLRGCWHMWSTHTHCYLGELPLTPVPVRLVTYSITLSCCGKLPLLLSPCMSHNTQHPQQQKQC